MLVTVNPALPVSCPYPSFLRNLFLTTFMTHWSMFLMFVCWILNVGLYVSSFFLSFTSYLLVDFKSLPLLKHFLIVISFQHPFVVLLDACMYWLLLSPHTPQFQSSISHILALVNIDFITPCSLIQKWGTLLYATLW